MKGTMQLILYCVVVIGLLPHSVFGEVLRLSHQVPPQHAIGQIVQQWADAIARDSHDEIDVSVFPSSQLIRSKGHLAAVARGHVQAALIGNHDWSRTVPAMGIFSQPFGFQTYQAFRSFLDLPAMTILEQRLADKNLLNLGWVWVTPLVGITSNQAPLIAPNDFDGVKIRGLNHLPNVAISALGASPVAISGGEVYPALQSHLIDAAITTLQGVYVRRYDEVQQWCVVSPLFFWAFSVTVNRTWWQGLTREQRSIIKRHTRHLEMQSYRVSQKELAGLPDNIRGRGMQLYTMTPQDIQQQQSLTQSAWEEAYINGAGQEGEALLKAYRTWRNRL